MAAGLCAVMLLLCGCSGQNARQGTGLQEKGTASTSSQTSSALESEIKTQPVEPETSALSSEAPDAAQPSSASSAEEAAQPTPQATDQPTTTTTQQSGHHGQQNGHTQATACQHSMRDVGGMGTCSHPGQHIYECTKCGYTEYGDVIPPHHDGKYTCEYCGIPLPEYPYIGVNVWLEESCGGAWNYQGPLGRCEITPCNALYTYDILGTYFSSDDSLHIDFGIREDGTIVMEFTGSTPDYHLQGVWDCSEINHNFAAQEVQGSYTDPAMQQQFETELSQALENVRAVFQQMITPLGFDLSTYGFTAW